MNIGEDWVPIPGFSSFVKFYSDVIGAIAKSVE